MSFENWLTLAILVIGGGIAFLVIRNESRIANERAKRDFEQRASLCEQQMRDSIHKHGRKPRH